MTGLVGFSEHISPEQKPLYTSTNTCYYMSFDTNIQLGTRKVQQSTNAHTINMPRIAMRTLDLHAGDVMRVSLTPDGAVMFEKE